MDAVFVTHMMDEIAELGVDADADVIASTARDLEGMNYSPLLLADVPGFLTFTKENLMAAIDDAKAIEDPDQRTKHVSLLVTTYQLLCRLRLGEPEAWDVVNEL
ncbi:MAG: hypothetical protein ACYTGH_09390, partial [Planctomycetota bacterium]